ncbi:MAG: hypothetical protein LBI89_00855 [Prevotellaceae bacterium]|jgi:hypothetical protein|nr:hypothetical protein [Prevotellaceae bacterium]
MTKKHTWKVWLQANQFTKEVPNDSYADVSTAGTTLHNEDIAQRIVKARSESGWRTPAPGMADRANNPGQRSASTKGLVQPQLRA